MNSKIIVGIEIVLILAYLGLVISGLIPTDKVLGVVIVGILTAVIFVLVILLEKKRKKSEQVQPMAEAPSEPQTAEQGAATQQQTPSAEQQPTQQPAQPPPQQPVQPPQ